MGTLAKIITYKFGNSLPISVVRNMHAHKVDSGDIKRTLFNTVFEIYCM